MNATSDYQPPLAAYFDELETRYGDQFSFDRLSDEELLTLERLGRDAIERDRKISAVEKANLKPLLTLVEMHRRKRGIDPGASGSIH